MIKLKSTFYFCIPCLLLSFNFSAIAQPTKDQMEKSTVVAIRSSINGLVSWKCTGTLSQTVSGSLLARQKARGELLLKEFPQTKNIEFSFQRPKYFFSALKNGSVIYAFKNADNQNLDEIHLSSSKTLSDFVQNGECYVSTEHRSYSVHGVNSRRQINEISKNKTSIPGVTCGFYIDSTAITPVEAIEKHGFRYIGEANRIPFGRTLIFKGTHPQDNQSQIVFEIAQNYGYRVVHCEILSPSIGRRRTYDITSLSKVKGFWLPDSSISNSYVKFDNPGEPEQTSKYTYAERSVNDVDDVLLGVKLSLGDHVLDMNTNERFTILADGTKVPMESNIAGLPKTMWIGWLYMASVTTLLVLTVGAYVKWKRNQLSKSA